MDFKRIKRFKVVCSNCHTELIIPQSENEFIAPKNSYCPFCQRQLSGAFSEFTDALNNYNDAISELKNKIEHSNFGIIDD